MTKRYDIHLKLTKQEADMLMNVVRAAVNGDKTHHYTEEGRRLIEIAGRQIKCGYTGKPAVGEL